MESAIVKNQRVIRVFISSTFLDMQAEREELIKRAFPQLRQFCEQRGVIFEEVDLRWGITAEDADDDKVIPICFKEIDDCRCFIGLLGERYGAMIDNFPDELLKSHPWLEAHRGKSITELEILYGVLNDRDVPSQAFFYFRDLAYLETLSESAKYRSPEASSREKLHALKRNIRSSGHPLRVYSNPEHAGNLIHADFKKLIEKFFPEEKPPTSLEREIIEQQFFSETLSRIYIGRQSYFDRLDDFVASGKSPLVVIGESGTGKSTLLASWLRYYRGDSLKTIYLSASLWDRLRRWFQKFKLWLARPNRERPDYIFTHFVGATVESTNWAAMLRRMIATLKPQFGLQLQIPEQLHALRVTFASLLQAVAKKGRVVLIIDGLDHLEDREQALDLAWLPENIPANVRLILSTGGGPTLNETRRRRWPTLDIKPLQTNERERFLSEYLKLYSKALSSSQAQLVTRCQQAKNPLFLRTLLEELRVFGSHDELKKQIEFYIAADSPRGLFAKVLERLENDYQTKRPALVPDSMKLLWAARQGLTETEMLTILGSSEAPLPNAIWSPLFLAVKSSLIRRSGVLAFFHADFRQAVEQRYLSDEREKQAAHLCLANYFARQNISSRQIDELPWHLLAMRSWPELNALLADPKYLAKAWPTHQYEIKSYWAELERRSPHSMIEAYSPVIDAPAAYQDCAWYVCILLGEAGYANEAMKLSVYLETQARRDNNRENLQASLSLRATYLREKEEFELAISLLKEQEQICRQISNRTALAASLGNQGVILMEVEQFPEARRCFGEEEKICRDIEDLAGLGANHGNQGLVNLKQDNIAPALKLFQEQEKLSRQLGDTSGLQKSLGHQGLVYHRQNKHKKALQLYKDAEKMCKQIGELAGLQALLGYQAEVQQDLGDYDQAIELLDEKEKISRKLASPAKLARTLVQKAALFAYNLKQPGYASQFIEEAYQLAVDNNLKKLIPEIEEHLKLIRSQL